MTHGEAIMYAINRRHRCPTRNTVADASLAFGTGPVENVGVLDVVTNIRPPCSFRS